MNGVIFLNFCSLMYISLITWCFFLKPRIKTLETKIYSFMLIAAVFELIFGIFSWLFIINNVEAFYNILFGKMYIFSMMSWIILFCSYVISISKRTTDARNKKIIPSIKVLIIIIFLLVINSKLKFVTLDNGGVYSQGFLISVTYIVSSMCILIMTVSGILNIKSFNRKYIPLWLFIFLGTVAMVIQYLRPELFLIVPFETFVTAIMYFTIENPDVKMLNELIENRKIIERSSEEKSIFLFKMSQGIKEPSKNIEKEITKYEEGKNTKEKVDNIIQNIEKENGKINYLVNDVMGLTSFDGSKIKKVEGSYNIYSLLEDIKVRAKGYKKNDIDYTFTTVENIPKELIGDRVAIKQVLMSLIINAFNNTSKGYVHVDVNSITKYDICRLVITIEDSGSGIEINKINEILNQEEELTNEEYLKLDKIDIDLPLSYKIIKSLGGTMYIRSEVGKGTSITITLDQYIIEDEDEKRSKRIEEYIKDKNSLGKILLVDDNEKEISKIKKYLNKKRYDVSLVMYGEEVIKRIKGKEKYDYIIIDDELETMSGISLLKELNKEKDNSKKIVILDKDKLFISDHYIEDGFNDYIDRENLIKELDRLF